MRWVRLIHIVVGEGLCHAISGRHEGASFLLRSVSAIHSAEKSAAPKMVDHGIGVDGTLHAQRGSPMQVLARRAPAPSIDAPRAVYHGGLGSPVKAGEAFLGGARVR